MEIKSWYEDSRLDLPTGEEMERRRQEALKAEADWRATSERQVTDNALLHGYAYSLMERELWALGDYYIRKFPDVKDNFYVGDVVYKYYGIYCMLAGRPAEAAKWFRRSLRSYFSNTSYVLWKDLAAAYIESGAYSKADYWIRRYANKERKLYGKLYQNDCIHFGTFYLEADMNERAIAFFLEGHPDGCWFGNTVLLLAKAYMNINQADKGLKLYEEYLATYKNDYFAFAEMGSFCYMHTKDAARSEMYYLKAIELAALTDRPNIRDWNSMLYDYLACISADSRQWEKCFKYLRLYFEHEYEGRKREIFLRMMDEIPSPENDEMGEDIYYCLLEVEDNPLIASISGEQAESTRPEDPGAEVKGADKSGAELPGLLDLDESMFN